MVNAPIESDIETDESQVELESVLAEQLPVSLGDSGDLLVVAFENERSIFDRVTTEVNPGFELDFRLDPTLRLANLLNGTDEVRIRNLAAAGVVHARVLVNMADNPNNDEIPDGGTSFERQMDLLTSQFLCNAVDVRKDVFRICRLMRKTQRALDICTSESQKDKPLFSIIELHERIAEKKSKLAMEIYQDVKEDLKLAHRELGRLINRFGAQNLSALVIQQHRAFVLAERRARNFTANAAEALKRISLIKARVLETLTA